VIEDTIPAALDGERVDRVVAMLTGCSRAEAADAIAAGSVRVEGAVATKGSVRVQEGQRVAVEGDPVRVEPPPAADPGVAVLVVHEDTEVIVVDKPAGLVVHPGAGHRGATLVHGLLARFPELAGVGDDPVRPGIVHRLDKGTSGLLVVARTPRAHAALVEQLSEHLVDRHYRALVWGHLDTPRGTIDAPVGRSRRDPLKMTVTATGRDARTHYEVLADYGEPAPVTLLECRLETGRTHQIRVHLRSIGRPVVGDELYGGGRSTIPMDRPFLHAAALSFDHPGSGQRVAFESPLPAELVAVLDTLT
jgi:23S rRNA pseudouridine1911/1915/1917 synthase